MQSKRPDTSHVTRTSVRFNVLIQFTTDKYDSVRSYKIWIYKVIYRRKVGIIDHGKVYNAHWYYVISFQLHGKTVNIMLLSSCQSFPSWVPFSSLSSSRSSSSAVVITNEQKQVSTVFTPMQQECSNALNRTSHFRRAGILKTKIKKIQIFGFLKFS